MLKQRLLTAAVLIPLLVWAILALPSGGFALLLAGFVLLGAWEWGALLALPRGPRAALLLAIGAALALVWPLLDAGAGLLALLSAALLWWLICFHWVACYPAPALWQRSLPLQLLGGLCVLVPSWAALVALHRWPESGPLLVLYLLVLIWVADSAAYFTGRRWGRRKLAPRVSPGKTWEGCWGALAGSAAWALLGAAGFGLAGGSVAAFVALSLVTVAFSILGDLVESLFKRHAGVKDSGTLFPGHGGVLDRIDSLTAAAPIFVLGLLLMGRGA